MNVCDGIYKALMARTKNANVVYLRNGMPPARYKRAPNVKGPLALCTDITPTKVIKGRGAGKHLGLVKRYTNTDQVQ